MEKGGGGDKEVAVWSRWDSWFGLRPTPIWRSKVSRSPATPTTGYVPGAPELRIPATMRLAVAIVALVAVRRGPGRAPGLTERRRAQLHLAARMESECEASESLELTARRTRKPNRCVEVRGT
jgi:hypothetical protein